MKKITKILMLAAVLLPLVVQSQNQLTVADGTQTTTVLPINTDKADQNQRTQVLYLATDLTAISVGDAITQLVFYFNPNSFPNQEDGRLGSWTLSMGETTATTMTAAFDDSTTVTQVFSGPVNPDYPGQTLTFELSTPYIYHGGNLLMNFTHVAALKNRIYFYAITRQGCGVYQAGTSSIIAQTKLPKCTFTYGVPTTCFKVTNLSVGEPTSSSLTLRWTDTHNSNATYSVFCLSPTDTILLQSGISDTAYTATGLSSNTVYSFAVMTDCGGGDTTGLTVPVSGRTACGTIDTLPYTCGFESSEVVTTSPIVDALPWCWERYTSSAATMGTDYPYSYGYESHTGMRCLYFFGFTGVQYPDTIAAVMPELNTNLYPINGTRLVFWAKVKETTSKYLYVGTMSNPADMSTFTLVDSVLVSGNTYSQHTVSMFDVNTNDPYIVMLMKKGIGHIFVDDIVLEEIPQCDPIVGLTLVDQGPSNMSIKWNSSSAMSYIVEVRQGNSVVSTANVVVVDTTAVITNLVAENDYQIYVRSVCTDNLGPWSPVLNVHIGYCIPSPLTVEGLGITGVSFGNMNNTTHPQTSPYYGNYTALSDTMAAGSTVDVHITYSTGHSYGTIIWVDWDRSMTYDSNEVVYRGESADNFGTTVLTASFQIPFTQDTGSYRMRIAGARTYFNNCIHNPNNVPNPCFSTGLAVAEDYTIVVSEAPPCPSIVDVHVQDNHPEHTTFGWMPGYQETEWEYVISLDDSLDATALDLMAQPVYDTTITFTDLLRDTNYYFHVRPVCSATDRGDWTSLSVMTSHVDYYYDVAVVVNNTEWGTVSASQDLNHILEGSTIELNAIANAGYELYCWIINGNTEYIADSTRQFTVDSNLTVMVNFAPSESTIDFSDILFWVGEGANEAVMAVNWADTALAWGYRWNGAATVADMMADIAAADPRFSYTVSGFLDDIHYIDTAAGMTTPLGITPGNYWGSTNNGFMDMGLGQTLVNGDFEKWADPAAGVIVDSTYDATYQYWWYTYVYPMAITPVTVPDTTTNHDGINDYEMSRVYAYPNPCTGTLYINNEKAERVALYDINGKLLEAIENCDTRVTLDMQAYPAGLYLLKVGNGVQKILKK